MTHARYWLAPAALVVAAGCGESVPAHPSLALQPTELGGEHASILGAILGPTQGYQLRYTGPSRSYRVTVETWSEGEVVARETLGAGVCEAGVDMLCGLVALERRRDGDVTDMTLVLDLGGTILHRDVALGAWDKLENEGEGTGFIAWTEPTDLQIVPGEPIVLWRWNRGKAVPLQTLPSPPPDELSSMLQVSITFRG